MSWNYIWTDLFRSDKADRKSYLNILRESALFKTLGSSELKALAPLLYERVYQPNETVFKQHDRGLGMYVILRGRIAIKTAGTPEDQVITVLAQGSFFGELALVEPNNVRSATAVALEQTSLLGFFKPDLMELMERKPDVASKILFQLSAVLGRRLLETTDRISVLARARGYADLRDDAV